MAKPAARPRSTQQRLTESRSTGARSAQPSAGETELIGTRPVRPESTANGSKAKGPKKLEAEESGAERLHVRIAHSGICSRRAAERLILEGRVTVNDEIVVELGVKVTDEDDIRVDGARIKVAKNYTVLLYKPIGVVTTLRDPQGRETIVRYLPNYGVQLKPVGRLDMDTEGLLLVTNDGELANRLAHPSYGVDKEYQVTVKGVPTDESLDKLRKGVFVDGRKTAPAKIETAYVDPRGAHAVYRMTIHEGRKRQIRLMFESVGNPVSALKRVRYGPLVLKGIRSGEARLLGKKEVDSLRKLVGLPTD